MEINRKFVGPRIVFGALGVFAVAVAATAFIPEYLRFAAGHFPIATVLHVHAALLGAWLATFLLQAWLAASGRVALHGKIGPYGIALGVVAWASMIVVEVRGLLAHPLPADLAGYDDLLQDVYTDTAFIVLLLWAACERQRPAWHKRLMTMALFVTLLAPIERVEWLPQLGIGFIWASVLWLDASLVVPLFVYDMVSEKRLHPATLRGLAVLLAAQAIMRLAWGTAPWRRFAFDAAHALRSAFQP
jgi:hypothetical protein